MHARIGCLRIMGVLALIAGLTGPGEVPSALGGANSAAITVHAFWCGASGDDLFPECHRWDVNALDNAEFRVAGDTRWTLNGYVTWAPSAGEHTIQGANLIRYRGVTVICTNEVTSMILYADAAAEDRVTVTTSPGQEVICDWYYRYGP
jgi:hypothetical protein